MAQTLMAHLPQLFQLDFESLGKKSLSCKFDKIENGLLCVLEAILMKTDNTPSC